ncbi:hypothetical protein RvY_17829 [Ramazzottius varieornatus]|uniref:Calnexin n=1 Tax=Ramazzottius varieornatus TaxID=947166 RepID=A0A1D1W986_RAMVA|nr:hypothetical protein RvY_17829 [Ramazzottius varieornatus]
MRRHQLVLLAVLAVTRQCSAEDAADSSTTASTYYQVPSLSKDEAYLFEPFASSDLFDSPLSWVQSTSKKDHADSTEVEKYDGEWAVESTNVSSMAGDYALVLKSGAKHHGIAVKLDRPYSFSGKPFVFQYDVKFMNGQECGGAYVKLLQKGSLSDLKQLNDKTPFTIMFGPDKCGKETHLRFIFQHKNPQTHAYEEKHWIEPSSLKTEDWINSKKSHLYTLTINPDSTFKIYVDQNEVGSGSLLEDFKPPVNPPAEVDDPEDRKPEDWDERKTITDTNAVKPANWDEEAPAKIRDPSATMPAGWLVDEPQMIYDEGATKPVDWDVEMDGEWEAPQVENPKCKDVGCGDWEAPLIDNPQCKNGGCGPWTAPLIENPAYKGKWAPRRMPNPDFFEDKEPYKMTSIDALALELWSISNQVLFDNFLITDDKAVADKVATATWKLKESGESTSILPAGLDYKTIGIIVATVVGLLTIVLVRSYFRKQPATNVRTEAQTGFAQRPRPQSGGGETDTTVHRDIDANIGDIRRQTETTTRVLEVEELVDDVPPLEGEAGSGDNQESPESDLDVEPEVVDDDTNTATKDDAAVRKRRTVRRE